MSYFVIEHPRHGVFIATTPTPHFTWKYAETKGKHFASEAEAQRVIDTFPKREMDQCRIVEKP